MPQAARLSDPVAHSSAMSGLIAGAVLGALIGAAAVATGGAALVAVAAVAGGAAAGAGIGEVLGSLSFMPMTVTGAIASGSPNVTVNSLPAARAHLDTAPCAGMPPLMLPSHGPMILAQGSMTVSINGMPAARVSDMLTCSAKIYKGSNNVDIGGPPATTDKISPEIPEWLNYAILGVGLAAACVVVGPVVAVFGLVGSLAGGYGGSWLGGKIFGQGSDGQKLMGLAGAILGGVAAGGIAEGVTEPAPAAQPGATVPGAAQSTSGTFPDFNPGGGDTNCGACSDAVDNYLAGKGATPAEAGPHGWPENAPPDAFTFGESPASIEQTLLDSGDGARGIVYVSDDAGNAHVFNVVNQNGEIIAIDGQTGVYGSVSDVASHAGYGDAPTWGFAPTGK